MRCKLALVFLLAVELSSRPRAFADDLPITNLEELKQHYEEAVRLHGYEPTGPLAFNQFVKDTTPQDLEELFKTENNFSLPRTAIVYYIGHGISPHFLLANHTEPDPNKLRVRYNEQNLTPQQRQLLKDVYGLKDVDQFSLPVYEQLLENISRPLDTSPSLVVFIAADDPPNEYGYRAFGNLVPLGLDAMKMTSQFRFYRVDSPAQIRKQLQTARTDGIVVAAHGNPEGVRLGYGREGFFSKEEVGQVFEGLPYPIKWVVVNACEAGKGEKCFAEQIHQTLPAAEIYANTEKGGLNHMGIDSKGQLEVEYTHYSGQAPPVLYHAPPAPSPSGLAKGRMVNSSAEPAPRHR